MTEPERSNLYWYADHVYLYRTTFTCYQCGYIEQHTASEAYVQLSRGDQVKSVTLRDYVGVVGDRMPKLDCTLRETDSELYPCPVCHFQSSMGHEQYSHIYAPGSDIPPEELEEKIAERKQKKQQKQRAAPPTLNQILKRVL